MYANMKHIIIQGNHPVYDNLCRTTGEIIVEMTHWCMHGMDLASLYILKLVNHIVVDWLLLHLKNLYIICLMFIQLTTYANRKYNRLRRRYSGL